MYCIDGYNLVYHCPELRPLALQDFEAARDALIDQVSRFCAATGERVKIVFDGRGRRPRRDLPSHTLPGLEVVYSPARQSADTVIERFVYGTTNRHEIRVVSADQGIRDLCRGLGAFVMDPAHFLSLVEEKLERVRADLRTTANSPGRKDRVEDRLDPETIARLRQLRQKLPE